MTAAAALPSTVQGLTLDLTSLAHTVTVAATLQVMAAVGGDVSETARSAAGVVEAWETLTGLTGAAALDAAQAITRHPLPVTAAVVPF